MMRKKILKASLVALSVVACLAFTLSTPIDAKAADGRASSTASTSLTLYLDRGSVKIDAANVSGFDKDGKSVSAELSAYPGGVVVTQNDPKVATANGIDISGAKVSVLLKDLNVSSKSGTDSSSGLSYSGTRPFTASNGAAVNLSTEGTNSFSFSDYGNAEASGAFWIYGNSSVKMAEGNMSIDSGQNASCYRVGSKDSSGFLNFAGGISNLSATSPNSAVSSAAFVVSGADSQITMDSGTVSAVSDGKSYFVGSDLSADVPSGKIVVNGGSLYAGSSARIASQSSGSVVNKNGELVYPVSLKIPSLSGESVLGGVNSLSLKKVGESTAASLDYTLDTKTVTVGGYVYPWVPEGELSATLCSLSLFKGNVSPVYSTTSVSYVGAAPSTVNVSLAYENASAPFAGYNVKYSVSDSSMKDCYFIVTTSLSSSSNTSERVASSRLFVGQAEGTWQASAQDKGKYFWGSVYADSSRTILLKSVCLGQALGSKAISAPSVSPQSPVIGSAFAVTVPGSYPSALSYEFFVSSDAASAGASVQKGTSSSYSPKSGDFGKYLKVTVTDTSGFCTSFSSSAYGPIKASAAVEVTGDPYLGSSLKGRVSTAYIGDYYYRWEASTSSTSNASPVVLSGPTKSSVPVMEVNYVLNKADALGKYVWLSAYSDEQCLTKIESACLPQAIGQKQIAEPVYSASYVVGGKMTISSLGSGVSYPNSSIEYSWYSLNQSTGAETLVGNGASYTVAPADYGKFVFFKVTDKNGLYAEYSAKGKMCATENKISSSTSLGNLSGSFVLGGTVTASLTTNLQSYYYKWFASTSSTSLAGAVELSKGGPLSLTTASQNLVLNSSKTAAAGKYIWFALYSDSTCLNLVASKSSLQTVGKNAIAAPTVTGTPALIGTKITLTSASYPNAVLDYAWYREGSSTKIASGASYTPVIEDLGKKIYYVISDTNGLYNSFNTSSMMLGPVGDVTSVDITGSLTLGQTLHGTYISNIGAFWYDWTIGGTSVKSGAVTGILASSSDLVLSNPAYAGKQVALKLYSDSGKTVLIREKVLTDTIKKSVLSAPVNTPASASIGSTWNITQAVSDYQKAYPNANVSYSWYAGSSATPAAGDVLLGSRDSRTIAVSDYNKFVYFKVTDSSKLYGDYVSKAIGPVNDVSSVSVSGTPSLGNDLSVKASSNLGSFYYRWMSGTSADVKTASPISGTEGKANSSSYQALLPLNNVAYNGKFLIFAVYSDAGYTDLLASASSSTVIAKTTILAPAVSVPDPVGVNSLIKVTASQSYSSYSDVVVQWKDSTGASLGEGWNLTVPTSSYKQKISFSVVDKNGLYNSYNSPEYGPVTASVTMSLAGDTSLGGSVTGGVTTSLDEYEYAFVATTENKRPVFTGEVVTSSEEQTMEKSTKQPYTDPGADGVLGTADDVQVPGEYETVTTTVEKKSPVLADKTSILSNNYRLVKADLKPDQKETQLFVYDLRDANLKGKYIWFVMANDISFKDASIIGAKGLPNAVTYKALSVSLDYPNSNVGTTVTAKYNADSYPWSKIGFEWYRSDTSSGNGALIQKSDSSNSAVNGYSYTLTKDDIGKYIYVKAIDEYGVYTSSTSTTRVGPVLNRAETAVTGSNYLGSTLNGSLKNNTGNTVYYRWMATAGTTLGITGFDQIGDVKSTADVSLSTTLVLSDSKAWNRYVWLAVYEDFYCTKELSSARLDKMVERRSLSAPSIAGTITQGSPLRASIPDAASYLYSKITYNWMTLDPAVGGDKKVVAAGKDSYTPTASDVGKYLYVEVIDDNNIYAPALSTQYGVISPAKQKPTFSIEGRFFGGDTITATASNLTKSAPVGEMFLCYAATKNVTSNNFNLSSVYVLGNKESYTATSAADSKTIVKKLGDPEVNKYIYAVIYDTVNGGYYVSTPTPCIASEPAIKGNLYVNTTISGSWDFVPDTPIDKVNYVWYKVDSDGNRTDISKGTAPTSYGESSGDCVIGLTSMTLTPDLKDYYIGFSVSCHAIEGAAPGHGGSFVTSGKVQDSPGYNITNMTTFYIDKGSITIKNNGEATGYDASGKKVTNLNFNGYVITQKSYSTPVTKNSITVEGSNVPIVFSGVNIASTTDTSPVIVASAAALTLYGKQGTDNSIVSTVAGVPAIKNEGTMTFSDGSLHLGATGNVKSAAIPVANMIDAAVLNSGTFSVTNGILDITHTSPDSYKTEYSGAVQMGEGSKFGIYGGTVSLDSHNGSDMSMTAALYKGGRVPSIIVSGGNFELMNSTISDNAAHSLTGNIANSDGTKVYQTKVNLHNEVTSSVLGGTNSIKLNNAAYKYNLNNVNTIDGGLSVWLPTGNVSAQFRSNEYPYTGTVTANNNNVLNWSGPVAFFLDKGPISISNGTGTGYDRNGNKISGASSSNGFVLTQTSVDAVTANTVTIDKTTANIYLENLNVRTSDATFMTVTNSTLMVSGTFGNGSSIVATDHSVISATSSTLNVNDLDSKMSGSTVVYLNNSALSYTKGSTEINGTVPVQLVGTSTFTMNKGNLALNSETNPSFVQASGSKIVVNGGIMKTSGTSFTVVNGSGQSVYQTYALIPDAFWNKKDMKLPNGNTVNVNGAKYAYEIDGCKTIDYKVWFWLPESSTVTAYLNNLSGYTGSVVKNVYADGISEDKNKLKLPLTGRAIITNDTNKDGTFWCYDSLTANNESTPVNAKIVYNWYSGTSAGAMTTPLYNGSSMMLTGDHYLKFVTVAISDISGVYDGVKTASTTKIQANFNGDTNYDENKTVTSYVERLQPGQTMNLQYVTKMMPQAAGRFLDNQSYIASSSWRNYSNLDSVIGASNLKSNMVTNRVHGPAVVYYHMTGSATPDLLTVKPWQEKDHMVPALIFGNHTTLGNLTSTLPGWDFHSWYKQDTCDKVTGSKAPASVYLDEGQVVTDYYGYWTAPVNLTLKAVDSGIRDGAQLENVCTTVSDKAATVSNPVQATEKARAKDTITYTLSYTNTNNQPESGTLIFNLPLAPSNDEDASVTIASGSQRNAFSGLKYGQTATATITVKVNDQGRNYGDAEKTLRVSGKVDYNPDANYMTHAAGTLSTYQTQKVENPIAITYKYTTESLTDAMFPNSFYDSLDKSVRQIVPGPNTKASAIALPNVLRDYYYGETAVLYNEHAYKEGENVIFYSTDDKKVAGYNYYDNTNRYGDRIRKIPNIKANTTVYVYWGDARGESILGW